MQKENSRTFFFAGDCFESSGGLVLIHCTRTCSLLKIVQGDRQPVRVRALVLSQFSNRDVKVLAVSVDMKKYIIT